MLSLIIISDYFDMQLKLSFSSKYSLHNWCFIFTPRWINEFVFYLAPSKVYFPSTKFISKCERQTNSL